MRKIEKLDYKKEKSKVLDIILNNKKPILISNFDILKFVLDDTPFSIKSKYKEYHKIWLENIKTIKNKDGILLKQEVVT